VTDVPKFCVIDVGPPFLTVIAVPDDGTADVSVVTRAGPETVTVIDSPAVPAPFLWVTQIVAAGVRDEDDEAVATTELSVFAVPLPINVVPARRSEVEAEVAMVSAAVTVTVQVTAGPARPFVPSLPAKVAVPMVKLYVPATEGAWKWIFKVVEIPVAVTPAAVSETTY